MQFVVVVVVNVVVVNVVVVCLFLFTTVFVLCLGHNSMVFGSCIQVYKHELIVAVMLPES